jgi:hypothetical protein
VGRPLYAEEQILMSLGSAAYQTYVYDSTIIHNNLTETLHGPPPLTEISGNHQELNFFSGQVTSLPINQTGITITFQNMTLQGDYLARMIYEISPHCRLLYLKRFPAPSLLSTSALMPYPFLFADQLSTLRTHRHETPSFRFGWTAITSGASNPHTTAHHSPSHHSDSSEHSHH